MGRCFVVTWRGGETCFCDALTPFLQSRKKFFKVSGETTFAVSFIHFFSIGDSWAELSGRGNPEGTQRGSCCVGASSPGRETMSLSPGERRKSIAGVRGTLEFFHVSMVLERCAMSVVLEHSLASTHSHSSRDEKPR